MIATIIIGTLCFCGEIQASSKNGEAQKVQYVNWRELKLPCRFESGGIAAVEGLRVWWTPDGGNSWHAYPESATIEPGRFIRFTAPEDGRYGFKLQAVDSVGNSSAKPVVGGKPDLAVVVDTKSPRIEILSPSGKKGFYTGETVDLNWQVHDENVSDNPVSIYYIYNKKLYNKKQPEEGAFEKAPDAGGNAPEQGGGKESEAPVPLNKEKKRYPPEGSTAWRIPLKEGSVSFLFEARDLAGNRAKRSCGPYKVTPFAVEHETREVVAEKASADTVVPVFYHFPEIKAPDIEAVELYWSPVEGTGRETEWKLAVTDADNKSPVLFDTASLPRKYRDGRFKLSVAVRGNGEAEYLRAPPPAGAKGDCVVLVDTHDPQVEVLSVNGRDDDVWLEAGAAAEVRFVVTEVNLKESPVAIEYSLDNGASWGLLKEGLEVTSGVPSVYSWVVPHITPENFRIRVRAEDLAGRTGSGELPGTICIRETRSVHDTSKLTQRAMAKLSLEQPSSSDTREAISALQKAVGYNPENSKAHYLMAQAFLKRGEMDKALKRLRKAVELSGGNDRYRLRLLELLLRKAKNNPTKDLIARIEAERSKIDFKGLYQRRRFHELNRKLGEIDRQLRELRRRQDAGI